MFLDDILESKRVEIAQRRSQEPLASIQRRAAFAPGTRDFLGALKRPGLGVIAEIKRRSPSRGELCPNLDPAVRAAKYEEGGCVAVSVVTDGPAFGALPDDLKVVRAKVSVPVLRKDFILSEYQVWEARAMGADAVLLIAAALSPEMLSCLTGLTLGLEMCPLVEVHSSDEMKVALVVGASVIGINNRDLHGFQVEMETTRLLRPLAPVGTAVVSESGFSTPEQAALAASWGVDAILAGEALVRSSDPADLIRALSGATHLELRGGLR